MNINTIDINCIRLLIIDINDNDDTKYIRDIIMNNYCFIKTNVLSMLDTFSFLKLLYSIVEYVDISHRLSLFRRKQIKRIKVSFPFWTLRIVINIFETLIGFSIVSKNNFLLQLHPILFSHEHEFFSRFIILIRRELQK